MKSSSRNPKIAQEAARWVVRIEEDPGPQCRAALAAWLKDSPRHVEEFLLTQAAYSKLDGVDRERRIDVVELLARPAAEVIPLHDAEEVEPAGAAGSWERMRQLRFGVAAGLLLVVAALLAVGLSLRDPDVRTYSTEIGEQRSIPLADGSVMHLNTRSRVAVRYSKQARDVRLLAGEALFTVAHDTSRPFRVSTESAVVQAVGTQFDVYVRGRSTNVAVLEGRVKVFAPEPAAGVAAATHHDVSDLEALRAPTLLLAGEAAAISSGRVVKEASAGRADPIMWRQRQMEFQADTLAYVVEQVNRYSRTQIEITDPAIAARRLTGVFKVDDVDALLAFLDGDDLVIDYDTSRTHVTIRAREPDRTRPDARAD